MVEVELAGVQIDQRSATPVMLLRESVEPRRTVAIYIGRTEAQAIVDAVQGVEPPRPLTHDLIRDILDVVGARVDRVVITTLVESTFYAELELTSSGSKLHISCRPSDAVAIAVRVGSPIFVLDDLIAKEGFVISSEIDDIDEPLENPEEIVGEFRDFLDKINPEDFS
ncbi:MAG: bifunctional nuclease family protein [Acidimicrobiaceae bacterium]|nr:bifunctional nuclease family protein [Acidimicrobiaceae bacterium]